MKNPKINKKINKAISPLGKVTKKKPSNAEYIAEVKNNCK
jgi:hypothetical protein